MKTKKNIVGLTYRHPHMPVLLKQQANNITSKFLEVMTSCFFFCSLYSATYTCCWFTRNTYRQYIHEFCCNSLSLRISGYLTDQNLNKYSNVIIHFLIKMNLKVKLIKWIGKPYLTVMI